MRKALRVKRVAIVLGILLVSVLTLIGILTVTRGTPVNTVIAIGDRNGPPPITDSLFARSMELYTGLHLTTGNVVEQVNNGDVYTRLYDDLRHAKRTLLSRHWSSCLPSPSQ
jgi:hypothetical protein